MSGFKTEYRSVPFVFLFLAEYGKIMFLCVLTTVFFLKRVSILINLFVIHFLVFAVI